MQINHNTIKGQPTDLPAPFSNIGINISNLTSTTGPGTGSIQIANNEVYKGYNGILISGFYKKTVSATSNDIWVVAQPGGVAQSGIYYYNCINPTMTLNFVTTDAGVANNIAGFDGESNQQAIVTCNNSQNVKNGFMFGTNPNTHHWYSNYMANNTNGIYLNCSIGAQGTLSSPSNNYWYGSTWSAASPNTFVTSTSPSSSSPLIVYGSGGSSYLPPYNQGTTFYRYTLGSTLTTTTTTGSGICAPISVASWRTTGDSSGDTELINNYVSVYEFLATTASDTLTYPNYNTDSTMNLTPSINWVNQMGVYQAILADQDSEMIDSSAILLEFDTLAAKCRYARLATIADSIVTGNYGAARSMMTGINNYMDTSIDSSTGVALYDGSGGNNVVSNYIAYYSLYIDYVQDSFTTQDTSNLIYLANLCPQTNGAIIFSAIALYSALFDSLPPHNNCGIDTTGGSSRYGQAAKGVNASADPRQEYQLYPNPNNGSVKLIQYILDSKPVNLEVYNSMGEKVEQLPLQFSGYEQSLILSNIKSGLYLIRITNNAGRIFNLKFIKE